MRELLAAVALSVPLLGGAADDPDVVFRFADPEILESSGLVVEGGLVVTVNDSGDDARLFTVSLETGETVGVTRWDGEPDDVEALAPAGDGEVWVGDIGDNARERSTISVIRVPYGRSSPEVEGEAYELDYPGDDSHDAETLMAHPRTGRLYVVTKGVFGGTVYAAPATLDPDGVNQLGEVGDAPGLVTGGEFLPGGDRVVLRDYDSATVHDFPSMEEVASFDLPDQQQGEGIAVVGSSVYLSSEGVRSPLRKVALPEEALPTTPGPGSSPTQPATDDRPQHPADAEEGPFRRDPWQWVLGTLVGIGALLVLWRALRPG